MNFDNENQSSTPRVTGLPESQFQTPSSGHFMAENTDRSYENESFQTQEYRTVENNEMRNPDDITEEKEIANWQAQDLIIGDKNEVWYLLFFIASLLLCGFAIWAQSWTFLALIIVSSIGILVLRKSDRSQIISYSLSNHGIYMGSTFHAYDEFRAFGVRKESSAYSIVFLPKKRFAPSTVIYFPKDHGEKITDIIGARLPMEEVKFDLIDKIIRKIKL